MVNTALFSILIILSFVVGGILIIIFQTVGKKMCKPLNQQPGSPMFGWQSSELGQEVIYPWEFIFRECTLIPSKNDNLVNCPDCMAEEDLDDDIIVVEHSSPPWTWRKLCGRTYAIYICNKHKRQFHKKLTRMN